MGHIKYLTKNRGRNIVKFGDDKAVRDTVFLFDEHISEFNAVALQSTGRRFSGEGIKLGFIISHIKYNKYIWYL